MMTEKIIEEVKKELRPKIDYSKKTDEFISKLKEEITSKKISAEIMIGGSYAKDTFIGENFDCDIFIRFKEDGDISKKLEEAIIELSKKLKTKYERINGSRRYFQIKIENILYEIIPVKYIDNLEDAENIMDYSPFHVEWIKKELKKKELNDDIRIMKQFLKSSRLYGAESHIQGFSGHVNDIIVLYYGGFLNTIKAISKWKKNKKTIIDYKGYFKGQDVTFFMNQSKLKSPLIVVDPIMKERNASAAMNKECYDKAIDLANEFLKNPSKDFFKIKQITKKEIEQKNKGFIVELKITPLKTKKDIAGAKIRRALDIISRRIKEEGFNLISYEWEFDECETKAYLILKERNIPQSFTKSGPSIELRDATQKFIEKHPNAKIKNEKYCVEMKREFSDVISALNSIIKEQSVLEKVIEIKII